ncbi:HAD family phosphatase [Methylobacterium sp. R2-1]|uniref:HAD family hydrolase n=1 Tax=Methylobacterium sp. R2-1 TaxID=2587064 RepID=UPI00183D8B02|nr:HAD-IA family hydrolase [Methylobacterium sp. R2-1]MBB2960970.1 HAD superfamily hydrolase (TIGR01509 family) [Methylobacterium sp. R2-1]
MSVDHIQASANPTLIFDCDGVLIDSEILVCRLVSEELTALGLPLSVQDVILRFAGRPEREMMAELERDYGGPLPESFLPRTRTRTAECYATELQAVANVAEVLRRLRVPFCVASSSAPPKLRLGLAMTGLEVHFGENIISAASVIRGKPASDVFLYAAGWMRAAIPDCLVIEDSVPGVTAARAAGIRTFGFTGGSHCPPELGDRLRAAGAEAVFGDMRELERLVPLAFTEPLAA